MDKEILNFLFDNNKSIFVILDENNDVVYCNCNIHNIPDGEFITINDTLHIKSFGNLYVVNSSVKEYQGKEYHILEYINVQHLQNAIIQLKNELNNDLLTGALSRKGIMEEVSTYSMDNRNYIVMCDVDNFKKINDTYGHLFGDRILKGIVDMFNYMFHGRNLIGRIGGDEFILLLKNYSFEEACNVLRSYRNAIVNYKLVFGDINVQFTMSFGINKYYCSPGISCKVNFDNNYNRADAALYERKRNGRNGIHYYNNGQPIQVSNTIEKKLVKR